MKTRELIVGTICLMFIHTSCWKRTAGSDSDSDVGTDTAPDLDTDTDVDTDTDIDTDTDTDTGTDTDSVTMPDTETITDTDSLYWWLHPYVESLVYVSWPQASSGSVHVEYEVDGQWRSTPTVDAEAGFQVQLIVGIPFETDAMWRVVHEGGEVVNGEPITTGDVPYRLPVAEVVIADEKNWFPSGKYLLTSINQKAGGWTGGSYWTIIIDRQGRHVWAQKTPLRRWTLFTQIAQTGDHILWDNSTHWSDFDNGAGSKVHFTYLDREIDVVDTPGLHHAFVQLPDGTLAWGSLHHDDKESLVEKRPGSPEENIIWRARTDWPGVVVSRGIESNCLYYAKKTNTYLYSFYTNNAVVEVDRATGTSLWWAGGVPGGYSFSPAAIGFDWQHGVTYTGDGTLLASTDFNGTTLVREYNVDHESKKLTQVWTYDSEVDAGTNGDAWRLANGNTLHVVGASGNIVEVQPNGEVVWRLAFPPHLLGRGEFIEDLYTLVSPK